MARDLPILDSPIGAELAATLAAVGPPDYAEAVGGPYVHYGWGRDKIPKRRFAVMLTLNRDTGVAELFDPYRNDAVATIGHARDIFASPEYRYRHGLEEADEEVLRAARDRTANIKEFRALLAPGIIRINEMGMRNADQATTRTDYPVLEWQKIFAEMHLLYQVPAADSRRHLDEEAGMCPMSQKPGPAPRVLAPFPMAALTAWDRKNG